MSLVDWIDANSTFITIVLTQVNILCTLIMCWSNYVSAKADRAQLKEMRRQYDEDNRPQIEAEFLFERETFYGLRFVNNGNVTAERVQILLDEDFVSSLPEADFAQDVREQRDKECVIGVSQHHDLFFGHRKRQENTRLHPATGKIRYSSASKDTWYETPIFIDLENYATIFSVKSSEDDFKELLKLQAMELKNIEQALLGLRPSFGKAETESE